MSASRERTTRAAAGRPLPLSAALLVARSFALVALAAVALVVALAAWLAVRAALAADPVVRTERVWLQYGHHRPPYAHVKLDPLKYNVPGPAYDVSLEATLPVNENNLRLGNFMVSLSLVDSLGSHAVNVSRPAILNPSGLSSDPRKDRSASVSIIRTLATLPWALISTPLTRCIASPAETHISTVLSVPLLENVPLASTPHVAGGGAAAGGRRQSRWRGFTSRGGERRGGGGPVDTIFVEIGRRDTYPLGRGREAYPPAPTDEDNEEGLAAVVRSYSRSHQGPERELQVYEAWIKVQVKPKGLRALVHRHPWITFLFFFPTFLTLEATAALAIYLYFVATAPSSAKDSHEVDPRLRGGEEEDLIKTTLPFGSGSGASSPAATTTTTTTNESEEPPTLATPSDYEHLSDDSELAREDEEDEVAAGERRRRQDSMRLGRGGVGMSAASLGGGGGGGGEEAEEEEEEEDRASEGETGVGFGVQEMEEAEWVKGEDEEEGASTTGASATTRRTTSTFGPSVAGTSSSTSSSSAAAVTGFSWPVTQARQREQAPRFSGRVDEADEADL
ncbi:hypothetical protein RHOSPDRAFT_30970 [Rhodotorula sp. JG-1b]|nr:hypothetical protein RHOSPDRAFT_30970 [Rhodotorula sp. JG-1b]